MPKKQKLGDWPIEVEVYSDEEAEAFLHDVPWLSDEGDKQMHVEQVAAEEKKPHPASLRTDDE